MNTTKYNKSTQLTVHLPEEPHAPLEDVNPAERGSLGFC